MHPRISVANSSQEVELQLIGEILTYWQFLATSDFQELAYLGQINQATQLWEKRAKAFYHRFALQSVEEPFAIFRNDHYWRYYRSIPISYDGHLFLFPLTCFRCQGLTQGFVGELQSRWRGAADHSFSTFFPLIRTLTTELLADLTADELTTLKTAIRQFNELNVLPSFHLTSSEPLNLLEPSVCAFRFLRPLYQRGLFNLRIQINYARLGLHPYLLNSQIPLTAQERVYSFLQGQTVDNGYYSALALPPAVLASDWQQQTQTPGVLRAIQALTVGWNLTDLTVDGWKYAPSAPAGQAAAEACQQRLEFHGPPKELEPMDYYYLERAQCQPVWELQAEFGEIAHQRLAALCRDEVLALSPLVNSIGCGTILLVFCQGGLSVVTGLREIASQFPQFQVLEGETWALAFLRMPSQWLYPPVIPFPEVAAEVGVEKIIIEVQDSPVERFIPFSRLLEGETKEWRF